jgi:antitoxin component YwqK of YwqJK toxin-antitoxin module
LVGTLVVSSFLAWGCRQPERVAAVQSAPQKNAAVEVVEEYWPNGKLRVRHEVRRQPDSTLVDHGAYTSWFDNGGKEYEAAFVNGKVNGVATRWHRNGVKASEQAYVLGQRHGPRFVWDENGRLRKEEHFVDDLPDGTWTTWNDEGQIKAQQKFERGAPK